jgi:hypothetical protein
MAFCPVCDSESASAFCTRCGSATKDRISSVTLTVFGRRIFVSQILAALCSASLLIFAFAAAHTNMGLRILASLLFIGLAISAVRYPQTVIYSPKASSWIERRLASARAGGWFSRWLLRPNLWLLDIVAQTTTRIPDPFLQAGCRFVLWAAIALTAILTILYAGFFLVILVFALLAICIGLWLLSVIFAVLNHERPPWPKVPRTLPRFFAEEGRDFRLQTRREEGTHLVREGLFPESIGPLHKTGLDAMESRTFLGPNIQIMENNTLFGRDPDRPYEVSGDGKTIGNLVPAQDFFGPKGGGKLTFEPNDDETEG